MDEAEVRVARALARLEYERPKMSDDLQANVLRRGPMEDFIAKRWERHVEAARVAIAAYKRLTVIL